MTPTAPTAPSALLRALVGCSRRITLLLALSVLLAGIALAQSTRSATDGKTPLALTPGQPAGSFALSDFDNINPYNGNLNFHLPLLGIGGRGAAQMTMMLAIDSKGWHINHKDVLVPNPECEHCEDYASTNIPEPNRWGPSAGYGAGTLYARSTGIGSNFCSNQGTTSYGSSLTRLTFVTPDGTEYELRDQLYAGEPQPVTGGLCNEGRVAVSRGTVFTSADGNAATFISDQPIYDKAYVGASGTQYSYPAGYLMLRDGTRYRIDVGRVTWMRDRNGNLLSFAYPSTNVMQITDSLNRQVKVEQNITDVAPYGFCTRITYKGFGGAQRVIRVSSTSLSNVLRPGSSYAVKTYKQLFPEVSGSTNTPWNPNRISAVWLPDGRTYNFYYNSFGELARVELPTGGAVEYDHTPTSGCINEMGTNCSDTSAEVLEIYRRVTTRRVYSDAGTLHYGGTLDSKTTFSDPNTGCTYFPCEGDSIVTVDHINAAGGRMLREKHYYYGKSADSLFQPPIAYPTWKAGREYQTETIDSNGTTILRKVENTWAQRTPLPAWYSGPRFQSPDDAPPQDVRLTQAVTTLLDTGTNPNQVSKQTYTYDQYNNRTDVYEYDYGDGAVGAFRRRTHTDYVTSNMTGGVTYDYDSLLPNAASPDANQTIHLRNLPSQQWVSSDVAGNQKKAITAYEYDNHTADAHHSALLTRPTISGLDAAYATNGKKTRGNVTAISRRLIQDNNRDITTYQYYDVAGNVIKALDANSSLTQFDFTDRFGAPNDSEAQGNDSPTELNASGDRSYAFATKVTMPAVSGLSQVSYTQFDYYLGKPVNAEDANGTIYSGYYSDPLDRPTQVVRAFPDATLRNQTHFVYDDDNHLIRTTSDRTTYDDDLLKSEVIYDGLGRTMETRSYEDATNYIRVEQAYDGLGRVSQASNPYRPLASPAETALWTKTLYDEFGRVTQVTTPDNARVSTTYSGNTATVRDQASKNRQSTTDALGRLTQVIENPGGLDYQTNYSYDVLDDLTQVTQGAQTRTFVYDSLKRLTQATNPESGIVKYEYDDDGNLVKKTDPRKVTPSPLVYVETNLSYDALNRVISKTYNDGTPSVLYKYDSQALLTGAPDAATFNRGESIGRLVSVTYGGTSSGTYYGYDGLGRMVERVQQTDGTNYEVNATYNRSGAILTEVYPEAAPAATRRTVSHSFDGAGRLSSLSTSGAAVTSIKYASHGALSSETYGTLVHSIQYNNRLQPTDIQLGTSLVPDAKLALSYGYGTTTNNGNVLSASITVDAEVWTQTFTYDALNRVDTAREVNGVTTWTQNFDYDQYGNRCLRSSPSLPCTPAVNAANNRLTGMSYDLAGNQLNDLNHDYSFDAENRIKAVDTAASYVYDGEGNRVRKLLGENIRMVYGIGGELLSEYDGTSGALKKEYIYGASGLVASVEVGVGTRYITNDPLGSPRIVTSTNGTVISRHDYQPFGEELFTAGGRTTAQGYSVADGLRKQFTSKERDTETGLDYFIARYYSSVQGRFISPDEFTGGPDELFDFTDDASANPTFYADLRNPQSLNKYQYCLNNPLNYIDPDGHQQQDESWYDKLMRFLGQLWKATGGGHSMEYGANGEESNRKRDSAGPLDMDYGTVARGSWETMGKGLDTYGEVLATLEPTGIASAAKGALEGDKTRVGIALAGAVIHVGGASVTMREAKSLVGAWSKGTSLGPRSQLIKHAFERHGKAVGSKNVVDYLRKAAGFNTRGARREVLENGTRIRYLRKDGTYIIKDAGGKIVSFGKN